LFGNENGARAGHSANAECSEDNDMVSIEQQLAAHAARAFGSLDTISVQSSALDQQESRTRSLPPPPDRATPDSPVAQGLADPHKDKQPSPLPPSSLPPSSPQELDDEGLACKCREAVLHLYL
jgi:hypothetical protein